MTKKGRLHRIFVWSFWISLIFTVVFTVLYIRFAVPDRLNLVVSEEEIFHFSLPPGVTFESESEEVVLGNASNIPEGQVRVQAAEPVSMYGTTEGSYQIGMKLFGIIRMKDIEEYETEEIAEITGCNAEAIRSNLSRARKKVREVYLQTIQERKRRNKA